MSAEDLKTYSSQSAGYENGQKRTPDDQAKLEDIGRSLKRGAEESQPPKEVQTDLFSSEEKAQLEQLRQNLVENAFNPAIQESAETKTEQNFGGPAELPDDVDTLYGAGSQPAFESETSAIAAPQEHQTIYQLSEELQDEEKADAAAAAKPATPQNIYQFGEELSREDTETSASETTSESPAVAARVQARNDEINRAFAEETARYRKITESQAALDKVMNTNVAPEASQPVPPQAESNEPTAEQTPQAPVVAKWNRQGVPESQPLDEVARLEKRLSQLDKPELIQLVIDKFLRDNDTAVTGRNGESATDIVADGDTRQEQREERNNKRRRKFGSGILSTLGWFGADARDGRKKGKYARKAEKHKARAAKQEAKIAVLDEKRAESLRQIAENEARKEKSKERGAYIAAQAEHARQQRRSQGGNR